MDWDFENAKRINMGYGRKTFSRIELRDILIAVAVLTAAFTIIFARSNPHFFSDNIAVNTLCWVLTAFVLVVSSFILHEFGHKFVAQSFGAWSEFRMYPMGLVLCLVFSFLGFLFAAPGAVYINGYIDDKMNGKISAAGPAVNLVIGSIAAVVAFILPGGRAYAIVSLLAYLNGFLALFNMIPIMPLDGAKILKWNPALFFAMVAVGLAIVICYFTEVF